MTAMAFEPSESRLPAFIAAVALHAGLLALVIYLPSRSIPPIGSSVPINIVSSATVTDTRPAVQAPETQTAAAPEPQPQAQPQPPAPPLPTFGQTDASAAKIAKPSPTQPSAQKSLTAAQPFDFNKLQQIIAHHAGGAAASSAPRGAARAQTDLQARPDAGQGISQSDLAGLQQLLGRIWRPNCDAPGGSSVKLQVKFLVGLDGSVLGKPNAGGLERSADPVVAAAALRAIDAVHQVAPYQAPYNGQSITVNFDAKEACAKR
jgi:protein TonB